VPDFEIQAICLRGFPEGTWLDQGGLWNGGTGASAPYSKENGPHGDALRSKRASLIFSKQILRGLSFSLPAKGLGNRILRGLRELKNYRAEIPSQSGGM
jgi:hypothetical protein